MPDQRLPAARTLWQGLSLPGMCCCCAACRTLSESKTGSLMQPRRRSQPSSRASAALRGGGLQYETHQAALALRVCNSRSCTHPLAQLCGTSMQPTFQCSSAPPWLHTSLCEFRPTLAGLFHCPEQNRLRAVGGCMAYQQMCGRLGPETVVCPGAL